MSQHAGLEEDAVANTDVFAGYVGAMAEAPLLGYLVLYSVFDGNVTPQELEAWFDELDLEKSKLPAALRADGAFEIATSNTKDTYPIPSRRPAAQPGKRRGGKSPCRAGPGERTATLMIRPVRRDANAIVCHLVREVRDSGKTRLSYTDAVAEVTFTRDRQPEAAPGAGTVDVTPNLAAIPAREHQNVLDLLDTLRAQFDRNCRYLTGDKMRAMLRVYIESLMAIKVRPTGGVYFVHRHQAAVLDALRILITRFGAGSGLYPVPLPHQDAMRDMVIRAWRKEQNEALQRLSGEIAEAQRAAAGGTITTGAAQRLYDKFRQLRNEASEHGRQLGTDLDEMTGAMELASTQITALLTQAG